MNLFRSIYFLIFVVMCMTITSVMADAQKEASPASINVRTAGAKGDGVADDTDVFQKALDQLEAGGGVLYVPVGDYRITRTLRVSGPSPAERTLNWIEIRGDGATSNLIGDGVPAILAAKELYNAKNERVYVNGLRVNGITFRSKAKKAEERCNGIDASFLLRWWCQNSSFVDLKTGIYANTKNTQTGRTTSVWIVRIDSNLFYACVDYAIKMDRVFDVVISNNVIEHGRGGIAIGEPGDGLDAAANNLRIINNVIEGLGETDDKPAILGSCWVGSSITGNYFEANSGRDIVLAPKEKDGWLRGLTITSNTFAPTAKQRQGNQYGPIRLAKAVDVTITGNFTTGVHLIDPASSELGRGINIASNLVNSSPAVVDVEGAKATDPNAETPFLKSFVAERWEVNGPTAKVSMNTKRGFQYQPRGESPRSISYAAAPPSGADMTYQPGDVIFNMAPKLKGQKVLMGWFCVKSGAPGEWKPLYIDTVE